MSQPAVHRTPFHDRQAEGGARFAPQDGWELPLSFAGWAGEVGQFRSRAGVCDLCHVGRIRVRGAGALDLMERAFTADHVRQEDDSELASLVLDERGGIVDRVRVLRLEDSWIVLTSPAAREGVLEHLRGLGEGLGAKVDDQTLKTAMVAMAGPAAPTLLDAALPMKVSGMPAGAVKVGSLLIARYVALRTTRCGLWCLEVILPTLMAGQAWRYITRKAGDNCVAPVGEIAQDVLRIEAGLPRLGHELNRTVDPFLAGLDELIDWGHDFVGRSALEPLRARTPQRRLVGLRIEGSPARLDPADGADDGAADLSLTMPEAGWIPRLGWSVCRRDGGLCRRDGGQVGTITSGTFSPTLGATIALAYVAQDAAEPGTPLSVGPDGPQYDATVTELPFV